MNKCLYDMEELKAPTLTIEGLDQRAPVADKTLTFNTEQQAYAGQLLQPLHEDDPALRKESFPFDFADPKYMHPVALAQTLIKCMRAYGGVGLSAIQIGIPVRAFSIGYDKQNQVFFNPEIVATGTELDKMKEGCISFPFCYAVVERPTHIRAHWQNEEGVDQFGDFSGFTARIFQHELDHLNGIVLPDKVGKLSWKLIKERGAKLYKKALKLHERHQTP